MTRVGINPARGKISSYRPAEVTIAVLTYIPDLAGYFSERLQILKLVLASLRKHTTRPYDLMVFDNGSCQPVVDTLRAWNEAGKIDFLLLSHQNIGKIGAWCMIFRAVPGKIVAYSDDDILFYPGWLEAHLEILQNFPRVGMVSGLPVRDAANHAHQSLNRIMAEGAPAPSISRERRIPDEWEVDWALSTGRDPQLHLQATREQLDYVLKMEKPGGGGYFEAIGTANHFQFVAYRDVLLQALPVEWSGKLMGHMVEFDEAIDQLGYLRLSTVNRYTRHLGNALGVEILNEAQNLGILEKAQFPQGDQTSTLLGQGDKIKGKHWLLHVPCSRRILSAIYNRLFKILYRS